MNKVLKNNKGITLVAAVVTIIVLLILAAVSVNLVTGENGLITKARDASKLSSDDSLLTDVKLKVSDYVINKHWKGEETFSEYFKRVYDLDAYGGDNNQYFVEKGNKVVFIDLKNNIAQIAIKWDGTVATGFESGTGTKEDPYIIKTPSQLAYLQKSVSEGNTYSNMYFAQTESFVLNSVVTPEKVSSDPSSLKQLGMIGTSSTAKFSGWYYGFNHYIIGLYVNTSSSNAGLFGYVDDGYINGLNVVGSYVKGQDNTGGIAGYATNYTYAIYCTFNGTVIGRNNVGGIFGCAAMLSYIGGCTSRGSISGGYQVGGIAGITASDVNKPIYTENCYNYANVTSTAGNVAGIVGKIQRVSYVLSCGNEGDVTAAGSNVGGIIGYGYNWGHVQICYNKGSIKGGSNVGGISGGNQVGTSYCHNSGNVEGNSCVGGIVGRRASNGNAYVKNSLNTGKVTGSTNAGDIIGISEGTSGEISGNYYANKCYGGVTGADTAGTVEITNEELKSTSFWSTKTTTYPTSIWVFEDGKEPYLYFE